MKAIPVVIQATVNFFKQVSQYRQKLGVLV